MDERDALQRSSAQTSYNSLPLNFTNMSSISQSMYPVSHDEEYAPETGMYDFDAMDSILSDYDDEHMRAYIDPSSMWHDSKLPASNGWPNMYPANCSNLDQIIHDRNQSVRENFGQLTPPEDRITPSAPPRSHKRKKPEGMDNADMPTPSSSKRSRKGSKDSKYSKDSKDEDQQSADGGGQKKEKYREKNRIAAAKCRAKKKNNTDDLEETHRTQSMLHSALRNTEQTLRDELSYWRTQALQHSFCDCRATQEYNMGQARSIASEPGSMIHSHSPTSQAQPGLSNGSSSIGSSLSAVDSPADDSRSWSNLER